MRNIKYILVLIAVLMLGMVFAWADDEKDEKKESDDAQAKEIAEALLLFDQVVSGESPDVIEMGQMLNEEQIDPVTSKSGRDNPFDEWAPPEPIREMPEGMLGPLPPPMLGPEEEINDEPASASIVDGVQLAGIMEIGDKKIAILKYAGMQKSIKTGEVFMGPVKLVLTEIGEDCVVLTNEDGSKSGWVGFSFATPHL